MTNTIKAQIRLRTDTLANWTQHSNAIINSNELIVVKYDNGNIGLKIGSGTTYALTPFIKFNSLNVSEITDGTNTFALTNIESKTDHQTDINTLNALIATLVSENYSQDSMVATLVTENYSQDSMIATLVSENYSQDSMLATLVSENYKQDALTATLISELNTANSNISELDSKVTNIENKLDYEFYTPQNINGTYSLKNKCINYIRLETSDSVEIVLPSITSQNPRDFVLRLELVMPGDIPTISISIPSGETIDFEPDEIAEPVKGVNIYSCTETYRSV